MKDAEVNTEVERLERGPRRVRGQTASDGVNWFCEATWRNMRDSQARWCSPVSTIVRSAGRSGSSSVQTRMSVPA
jgi:hypothetical protein